MFSKGLLINKCPFQDEAMPGKNCLFQAHCQQVLKAYYSPTKYERPHCKQDEYSSLSVHGLCEDVHGCRWLQNSQRLQKPPPMQMQSPNLPVFPHPCLYAGNFNCHHVDWDYDDNSSDGECLAGWTSINSLALHYDSWDATDFYIVHWNTGINPNLAFSSTGPYSCLPDRCVFKKFPRSQH